MVKPATFAVLVLSSFLFGCGGTVSDVGGASGSGGAEQNVGSAPDATCGAMTPCGGNIVGRWRLVTSCVTGESRECADYTDGIAYSGDLTYVFEADGLAHPDGSATMTWDLTVTDACAVSIGMEDAAAYCDNIQMPVPEQEVTLDAECTTPPGRCECHVVRPPVEFDRDAEPYRTSGPELTLGDETLSYCVDGDRLRLGLNGETTGTFVRD